jgi:hypothetical protein
MKQVEAIRLIREQREKGTQDLAFHARPFILCGLLLRRPPPDQLSYTRRNGKFFLQILAHPQFGLPFGQDRLIPIWVATLALRQKSREVRFDSTAQMLDFFRLPKDGFHYCRLVQAFKRVFSATIFFGTEEQSDAKMLTDWARFHFFDSMKLWYARGDRYPANDLGPEGNVITLSEAFYKEIDQHRIPVEREVVSSLAHTPGVLDFYLWIAWKAWTVNGSPSRIPITGHGGLCDQLGTVPYSVPPSVRHAMTSPTRLDFNVTLGGFPQSALREMGCGRAHSLAPVSRVQPDPGGVGVGLALPTSWPAKTRGRQAVPLRRLSYRPIEGFLFILTKLILVT